MFYVQRYRRALHMLCSIRSEAMRHHARSLEFSASKLADELGSDRAAALSMKAGGLSPMRAAITRIGSTIFTETECGRLPEVVTYLEAALMSHVVRCPKDGKFIQEMNIRSKLLQDETEDGCFLNEYRDSLKLLCSVRSESMRLEALILRDVQPSEIADLLSHGFDGHVMEMKNRSLSPIRAAVLRIATLLYTESHSDIPEIVRYLHVALSTHALLRSEDADFIAKAQSAVEEMLAAG